MSEAVAVAIPKASTEVSTEQLSSNATVTSLGQKSNATTGAISSTKCTCCSKVDTFPQASVAV